MNFIKFDITPEDQKYIENFCQTSQISFKEFLEDLLKLHRIRVELLKKNEEINNRILNSDKKKKKS